MLKFCFALLICATSTLGQQRQHQYQSRWSQVHHNYVQQQPQSYYVVQDQRGQSVIHPNQPAHAGLISTLPAGSAQQQQSWDNQQPVVVRQNNQAPLYYVVQPQGYNWNQQAVVSGSEVTTGHKQQVVAAAAPQQYGGFNWNQVGWDQSVIGNVGNGQQLYFVVDQQQPSVVGSQVVGVQGWQQPAVTTTTVHDQIGARRDHNVVPAVSTVDNFGSAVVVPQNVGHNVAVQGHHSPGLYAILTNTRGDTVVTNDQTIGSVLPAVNFDNLRPGNVRRLEEPAESPVYHDGGVTSVANDNVDSFGEVHDVARAPETHVNSHVTVRNDQVSKVNVRDEQQVVQEEQQVQLQPAPVKAPVQPTFHVIRQQQPQPVKTGLFRFGGRRAVQVSQPVAWNYGTKGIQQQPQPVKTLAPAPVAQPVKSQLALQY